MSGYERRDVPDHPSWQADTNGQAWLNGELQSGRTDVEQRVWFVIDGKTIAKAALVCAAFHGPKPPDKVLCAHWNDVRQDDRPENLRWATYKENAQDAQRNKKLRIETAFQLLVNGLSIEAIIAEMNTTYGRNCLNDVEQAIRRAIPEPR